MVDVLTWSLSSARWSSNAGQRPTYKGWTSSSSSPPPSPSRPPLHHSRRQCHFLLSPPLAWSKRDHLHTRKRSLKIKILWREMSSFINCSPPTVINSTGSEPRPINLAVIAMLLFTWISSLNPLIMSYWALRSRESSWTCLPPSPSPCWAQSVGRTQSLHHIMWISLKI